MKAALIARCVAPCLALVWMALVAAPARADARLTVLVDVLKLSEAAHILRDEGLDNAMDLDAEMLGGRGGAGWQAQVDAVYNTDRMVETVRGALARALQRPDSTAELEEVISFFASDLGAKIVSLENSARAAIQDDDVEQAARARYGELLGSDNARLALIQAFVESGDMINRNVTAAMNSNYQFMRGLADGNAIEMDDEELLADVTGDLGEITVDTASWLYGYLLLAYHPLSDAELRAYLSFSETPAGQALNRGLFDGFGQAYEDISYALGWAVALNLKAEDL